MSDGSPAGFRGPETLTAAPGTSPAACSTWQNRRGDGFSATTRVPLGGRALPRLSDRWTRLADMEGDGFGDLVRLTRGGLQIWQHLGSGRFADPRWLFFSEPLPTWIEPEQIQLVDLTGTGAADLVVVVQGGLWFYANGCGASLQPVRRWTTRKAWSARSWEPVDLLGTGNRGLLYTQPGDGDAWTFYELWGGHKPDLLASIDNGMGAITTVD